MEEAKEEFMREFGANYGYPGAEKNIEDIRALEFKRLEGTLFEEFLVKTLSVPLTIFAGIVGTAYLDHAGATLYSEAQMEAISKDLISNVYGNPRIHEPGRICGSALGFSLVLF